MPEWDYYDLLEGLDKTNKWGEDYKKAYLTGLAELLGENLTKVFDSEYAPATKQSMLSTARLTLKVHDLTDYLEQEPFNKKLDEITKVQNYIWDDEYKILINMPTKKIADSRDRMLYVLIRETGATASEVLRLDYRDIDFLAQTIKLTNKDRKTRKVPFNAETLSYLNEYLKRRSLSRGRLFLSTHKKNATISTRHLRRRFGLNIARAKVSQKRQEELGLSIREISKDRQKILEPRSLRNAFAKEYIKNYLRTRNVKEPSELSEKLKRELRTELAEILGVTRQGSRELIKYYLKI